MLTIGEFANICKISIKTLRYYSDIGLVIPEQKNPQTGYRYYSINQLERVLYIHRLKAYNFTLDEIKNILDSENCSNDSLIEKLIEKRAFFERSIEDAKKSMNQLEEDLKSLRDGKSIMSYMDDIDVKLVDFPSLNILYIRKKISKENMSLEYQKCFNKLLSTIISDKLTVLSKPMVMFHSNEFNEDGIVTEFAIQVKECITGTRDFNPGLSLKCTHKGSYQDLPSIYTKLLNTVERDGYKISNALFEIYITDPSDVDEERDYVTEVYLPVKKLQDLRN